VKAKQTLSIRANQLKKGDVVYLGWMGDVEVGAVEHHTVSIIPRRHGVRVFFNNGAVLDYAALKRMKVVR